MLLQTERESILNFKEKLISSQDLSREDLLQLCTQFEDTIELASVSLKIINRLRTNLSKVSKTNKIQNN